MAKYFCSYCGAFAPTVQSLVYGACQKSPTKKHVLYEGSEKPKYTCKHCGVSTPSIQSLTAGRCMNSPTKYHEPAL